MAFLITENNDGKFEVFNVAKEDQQPGALYAAESSPEIKDFVLVDDQEQLKVFNKKELAAIHKHLTTVPSPKNWNKANLIAAIWEFLHKEDTDLECAPEVDPPEDFSSNPTGVKDSKKAKPKANSGGKKGTKSNLDPNARIKLLVEDNPKRAGSASHDRFALYKDGMTIGEFLEQGGTTGDVYWDRGRGFIDVEASVQP